MQGTAGWGAATFDGQGNFTGTTSQNAGGTVLGPVGLGGATYEVEADGATILDFGVPAYEGWMDPAGDVVLTADTTATDMPQLIGLVRRTVGFSTAALAGEYHAVLWLQDLAGAPYCSWGDETLDGAGAATWFGRANDGGVIKGSLQNQSSYTAQSDGTMTYGLGMTRPLAGGVGAGGDFIMLSGSSVATDAPILRVLIRKTSGATAATLSGAYHIVGIKRTGAGFQVVTGSATSNGAGGLVVTLKRNTDGVITTSGPTAGTYTTGSDGSLDVQLDGAVLRGGFSAGGGYAVLGGDDTGGGDPAAYILLRR